MNFSMRTYMLMVGLAVFTASTIVVAEAGEAGCANCYRRIVTPPVYRTVHEAVVVRPASTVAHTLPAQFTHVTEQVLVRPASTVAHTVPAMYRNVAERVLTSPARKVWQVTHDKRGHEIGCWVVVPASYGVVHRQEMVSPARVVHQAVPAVYGAQTRVVMSRPAQVVHQTIPAVVESRPRTELVQPATSSWRPIRHGGHGYQHRRPHH